MHKRGLCRHAVCPSVRSCVCVSVCLSRSWILSKRIIVSSKFSHRQVATPFWIFRIKRHSNIPTGTPLTGASNAGGVGRNRDPEPISGFTACFEAFQRQVQAATDHDEFITLVAGKRPSSLMAGNIDEVCDKKPQCYAKDNVTQW